MLMRKNEKEEEDGDHVLYSGYINTLGTRGILISKSMQLLVDDPSLQNYKKFLKKPFFGIYTT